MNVLFLLTILLFAHSYLFAIFYCDEKYIKNFVDSASVNLRFIKRGGKEFYYTMIMKVYILWVVFLFAVFSSVDCTPIEFENRRTLSTTTSTCIQFPPHELAVLYDFYVAGNGDLWSYPPAMGNPWNFNQPNPNPCSQNWAFVNCTQFTTQDNCSITEIVFFRSYYSGTIPSSVSNLTNLVIFAFQYEYGVYGTIPSSIGKQLPSTIFQL